MKKIIFIFILHFCALHITAQVTDFNTVITPVEMKAKDITEYLVQLAWLNNPDNNVMQEQVQKSKDELKVVKKDWMKDFQLNFNLNESNLARNPALPNVLRNALGDPILDEDGNQILFTNSLFDENGNSVPLRTAGGSAFYPKYNFSLSLNLGNLASQKNKNEVKRHDIVIAEHKVNQQKLAIRAETLIRYQEYRLAKEILKTRVQIEQDAYSNQVLINELYKKDERTFEEFNKASSAYHEAMEQRIKGETDVLLARYKLEEIIGVKWEQVQHPQKDL